MFDYIKEENEQEEKKFAEELKSAFEKLRLNMVLDRLGFLNKEKIDSPYYYKSKNNYEAIDIIEDFYLNFNLGNVVKYVLRAGKKDDKKQDLEKALWYLNRELKNMEAEM